MDVRAFGTGERIVFLPYDGNVFAQTQQWIQQRQFFPELIQPVAGYDEAALARRGWRRSAQTGVDWAWITL